jgi:ABC-2 type transport system ATP-binding protein
MTGNTAISVSGLSKDFVLPHEKASSVKSLFTGITKRTHGTTETQHVLKDISFEVKEGEFLGIMGRNGGGKSTLLKILASIYQPTRGQVRINGKMVPFIELGVGFNPELTGRENVYLSGALLGFSTKEMDRQYDDIVEFAELEKFMDQKLKNYSSGMEVRLAFSTAIRANADILLIDEVLAVGDAAFQRKCYQHFKLLKKQKKTVIFVSHDMDAVRKFCDRAILVEEGAIAADGEAEKITQAYLKLFSQGDSGAVKPHEASGDNRWGNRWAYFENIDCQVGDDKLTIKLRIKAGRDTEDMVYGFRIRSAAGEELLGTNSTLLGSKPFTLKKGQKTDISWELPNILSDGQYFIDPAITVDDGATVCDWWNEAANIRILKNHNTPYPVTPEIKLLVNGDQNG